MSIDKAVLYKQFNTREPQMEEVILKYVSIENVRDSLLRFSEWLKANEITPQYADFDGQSPFWEIDYRDKTYYVVLNGANNICIMVQVGFSDESQAVMQENNLQDIVLSNLQYCTRKDGGHCNNCHLPSDMPGVDKIIFGKAIANLCCGQFVSFNNPSSETIEGIKKLLEL